MTSMKTIFTTLLGGQSSSTRDKTRNVSDNKLFSATKTETSTKASFTLSSANHHRKTISLMTSKTITLTKQKSSNIKMLSLPKVFHTNSEMKQINFIFTKGLTPKVLKKILLPESLQRELKVKHKSKSRNIISLCSNETYKDYLDKEADKEHDRLKASIAVINKKHRSNLFKDNNRIFSSDFKVSKSQKFTKDFRIIEHSNFDYNTIGQDEQSEINDYMNYNIQNTKINNLTLGNEKLSPIQIALSKLQRKSKEEIYAKWKTTIVRAAEHFKRCHLTLEDLYDCGYDYVSPFQEAGSETLFKAIKYNDIDKIHELLSKNKKLVHVFDYFHQTALHWVAKRNHYCLISKLIFLGGNINAKDSYGRTPLHLACVNNCYESVLMLLYLIASPFIEDKGGQTAVQLTNKPKIINAFKRATLLHLIHSMGKQIVFNENFQRGFIWYINHETNVRKSKKKKNLSSFLSTVHSKN